MQFLRLAEERFTEGLLKVSVSPHWHCHFPSLVLLVKQQKVQYVFGTMKRIHSFIAILDLFEVYNAASSFGALVDHLHHLKHCIFERRADQVSKALTGHLPLAGGVQVPAGQIIPLYDISSLCGVVACVGRWCPQELVLPLHCSIAQSAHGDAFTVQLNRAIPEPRDLAAQQVAVQSVLISWALVGVQRDGIVDLATVKVLDETFLVVLVVLIEQLLHLQRERRRRQFEYYSHVFQLVVHIFVSKIRSSHHLLY